MLVYSFSILLQALFMLSLFTFREQLFECSTLIFGFYIQKLRLLTSFQIIYKFVTNHKKDE